MASPSSNSPENQGLDLQLVEQRRELGGGALGLLGEGRIVAGQLARRRRVVEKPAGPLVVLDGGAEPRRLLRDRLGGRRVVPKVRTGRLLVQRGQLVATLSSMRKNEKASDSRPCAFSISF